MWAARRPESRLRIIDTATDMAEPRLERIRAEVELPGIREDVRFPIPVLAYESVDIEQVTGRHPGVESHRFHEKQRVEVRDANALQSLNTRFSPKRLAEPGGIRCEESDFYAVHGIVTLIVGRVQAAVEKVLLRSHIRHRHQFVQGTQLLQELVDLAARQACGRKSEIEIGARAVCDAQGHRGTADQEQIARGRTAINGTEQLFSARWQHVPDRCPM